MLTRLFNALMISAALTFTLWTVGCNQPAKSGDKKQAAKDEPKHDGWWCQEHGVPENLCSLCNADVEAKYKKEGKWCKLHDRAEEQCFKCDPARYKKYEDMYVAKYGHKPEPPPAEEFKK